VERGGLPNGKVGEVGVSGGEDGPAGWGNARFGAIGRIFARYPRLSQITVVMGVGQRVGVCFNVIKVSMPSVDISNVEKKDEEKCSS
jgi:hypothetical protein